MRTINVNEATNVQLDWLSAQCAGIEVILHRSNLYSPSKELISTGELLPWYYSADHCERVPWSPTTNVNEMWAILNVKEHGSVLMAMEEGQSQVTIIRADKIATAYGPTALVAAVRCYVKWHKGETAEVPEEL
jgi:hypothetical protein